MFNVHYFLRYALSTSALAPLLIAGAANAQTPEAGKQQPNEAQDAASGPQLSDIIVTAQKRAENLQNVPIAVSVVQASALEASGVREVTELAQVTPGLVMNQAGSNAVLPRIRGVGQVGQNIGLENPVAIYVDGVYYASSAGSMFSFNNIQQIAVLKGPQGTLFGRNATGGLIQVTTLDPSVDFGGKIRATYGNLDTIGGQLYVTGGLTSDIAADVAVYYKDQDNGFGRDLTNGLYVNDSKDLAIRSKIKANLGPDTTVTFTGDYARAKLAAPAFRSAYGTLPINGQPFTGDKFDIESDIQPSAKVEQWGGSATLVHNFGGATFTSISALRNVVDDVLLDNDALPAPTTVFVPDAQTFVSAGSHERTFSQEFQLASDDSGPLKWTAGLYYFQLKGHYDPPVVINQLNGGIVISIDSNVTTKSYAGYGQVTYEVSDNFNVTGGLRYTKEKRKVNGTLTIDAFGLFIPSEGSVSFDRITWRLAADYRPSEMALVYASYNRGFKSGGFNPTEIPFNSFEPERIDAYEAGLKLDLFDRRLRINPAFYYYDYTNLQAILYVNGQPLTQNAATAKIYGMDVDVTAALADGFTLTGGLSYTHARYGLYRNAQITTPDLVNGGNIVTNADLRHTRLANTPDWTANLGAEYTFGLGDGDLTLSGNYAYNDGYFGEAENRQRQRAYHLVNAAVEYKTSGGVSVAAWAKNIGNVAYASQLYTTGAGDKVRIAPGRTYGVTLGFDF